MKGDKHQFALYFAEFSKKQLTAGQTLTIKDVDLFHRIVNVLRLQPQEQCIFFDEHRHGEVTLQSFDKKNTITVSIDTIKENSDYKPHISFLLPILKREAFEHALYSLVELGANEIQLITTQKAHRKWGGSKELERLQRIMIAAAEQSKNFALPKIKEPVKLSDALQASTRDAKKVFFDAEGVHAYTLVQALKESPKNLVLLIGPEGDLTLEEKSILQQNNVEFCRLTPTILRAEQAVIVAMGLVRSLF